MFFKKYKSKHKCDFGKLKLFFFGVEHYVDFVIETEEDNNLNKEDIDEQCRLLTERIDEVEAKLVEYVESNYYNIIIEFYASIDPKTISKKESSDFRLVMNDLKNNTMSATDIILKNIKPIYFSIVDNTHSYLFVYLGYTDGYGLDIVFNPEIIIHGHDGEI